MKTRLQLNRFSLFLLLLIPAFLVAQENINKINGAGSMKMLGHHKTNNAQNVSRVNVSRGVDEDAWIHYDDTENSDSWGFLLSGEIYDVVAKWDPEDISDYDGWVISKIKFIVVTNSPIFKVKVWTGPNAEEIYSQDVDAVNVNNWTEITLETPVEIDASTELWVGYYVDYSSSEFGGFVTATDDGPSVDEYGNLYRLDGNWYSDFNNHNLQVFIEANLNAEFEADETVVCAGSTVNFTSLSTSEETYDWTFEGGTPSASSDENPSVVYDTPGEYDVTLVVTGNNETDTELKQGYITVLGLPGQTDIPEGESMACTGQSNLYAVNPVLYAQIYEWELNPADAGILVTSDTSAVMEVAEDWAGDFTIRARATNICGDGDWSGYFEGTVFTSPDFYDLEGGGAYCLNGEGVEITLSDSQTDVEYELYLSGEATGNVVSGTGSEISFGLITEEGNYNCIATNGNCEETMNEQVEVTILFPPVEPDSPTGPEVICQETSSIYESDGSDDADSYVWGMSPEEAGTIMGDGLEATVTWNSEFSGIAMISILGVNDCGESNPSTALEVSVGSPTPEIEGEAIVCDWSEETYQVVDTDGSTYTWEVTGGTISDGQGTHMVTVSWEGVGNGALTVIELTADGCEGASELFELVIDDCTGLDELNPEKYLSVNPNPVSGSSFVINTGTTDRVTIKIINSKGNVVSEFIANKNLYRVDFSSFPSGIYLLQCIYKNDKVGTTKFLKY